MTRYLLLSIFLIFNFTSASNYLQLFIIDGTVKRAESISNFYDKIPDDFKSKRQFLDHLSKYGQEKDDNELIIIYKNLLANAYAIEYDSNNPKSNSLYAEALNLSKNDKTLNLWSNTNYAFYLYNYRKLNQSLQYFINAIHLIDTMENAEIVNATDTYKKIGYLLGTIGEYETSINYLKKGLPNSGAKDGSAIMDNIGNYYIKLGDYKKAEEYLLKAKKLAEVTNDEVRKGKIFGNLALIKQHEKKYDQAIKLLEEDIMLSQKHHDDKNIMHASIQLASLFVEQKDLTNANTYLEKAEVIANSKSYYKKSLHDIYQLKFEIIKLTKNDAEELRIRRKLSELEEVLSKTDGESASQKANWLIRKEQYNHKIHLANTNLEKKSTNIKLIVLGSLFAIIFVIAIYQYSIKKLKIKQYYYDKKILSLQIEKLQSEKNLKENNITIRTYKDYLNEKNQQIKELQTTIDKMSDSKEFSSQKLQLQELLNSHLMTDENWTNFKIAFKQEHQSFYDTITNDFPEATDSNQRIIFLMKLGLNNREIASLLGISTDSIKKSNQRLRKKLGDKADHLFEMI